MANDRIKVFARIRGVSIGFVQDLYFTKSISREPIVIVKPRAKYPIGTIIILKYNNKLIVRVEPKRKVSLSTFIKDSLYVFH